MSTIAKFTQKEKVYGNVPGSRTGKFATPKRRQELSGSNFLLPNERKFPYKTSDGKVSRRLLIAAIHRAAQYGYHDVESRARRLLEENFGKERKGSNEAYVVNKKSIK